MEEHEMVSEAAHKILTERKKKTRLQSTIYFTIKNRSYDYKKTAKYTPKC